MYKCNCCGRIFNEPFKEHDSVEYWGYMAWRPYYICPYCREEDFDEYSESEEDNE